MHAPHFCVCQRKELHKNLESLLHTPPANRSQRSPCDLVSSCKRKKSTASWTPSLLPGSNMAGQTESFQNIPLQPSALPFHLPSAALPRVRTQEPDNRLASRPPRETRPPPRVRQSKAVLRRLAGPSGPAPSLAVACGFPASSAAVGRAGRSCGHGRVAGACLGPQRSAGTVIPAASSMDFEDGERRAGRAAAAGGREGGGRPAPGVCLPPQDGRVALFCGPRGGRGPGREPPGPGAAREGAADRGPYSLGGRPLCEPRGLARGRLQLPGLAER